MPEKLPVTQNTVDINVPARVEEGRAVERRSPLVPMSHVDGKSATKPSFAITPGKMREALFFRWKLALLVGLILAGVGAGLAWITYAPTYTAITSIFLIPSKPPLIPGVGSSPPDSRDRENFQQSHAYMIKNGNVLPTVLKRDDIRGLSMIHGLVDPVGSVAAHMKAGFVGGSDICNISLSGENPEEIAMIVNAVRELYVDQVVNGTLRGEADHSQKIENITEQLQEDIRKQSREIRLMLTDTSLRSVDKKVLSLRQTMAVEEFALVKRELYSINSQIRKTKVQLKLLHVQLEKGENQPVPAESIEEYLDSHPEVKAEHEQIANLERKIQDYRKFVQASSPRLRELGRELNEAQAKLQKIRSRVRPYVAPIVQKALYKRQRDSMAEAEGLMTILNEEKEKFEEEATKLRDEAEKLGIDSFELEAKMAEKAETEGSLKRFRAEKERLKLDKYNNSLTVYTVQPAEVPTVNEASLLKTGGIYGLVGLLLGFLSVSYLEARLHRVHKPAEVRQNLGIHTLGVLPLLAPKVAWTYGRALPGKESLPGIVFTDAVDTLCASLLCDDRLCRSKVIMVTSAGANEGKTMLAMQLAGGFARSGHRTLFLDCDFRNSRCQEELGLAAGPGLSEVLRGEAELPSAMQTLPNSEVRILPAGKSNPQITKALSNGTFAALLARLRQDFDCIIVDSAPTPVVADGLIIGKMADGVILVVRSNVSKARAVVATYEQLAALKIHTLGAVVNANPGPASSRYYAS
jgi:succinoglycan biosynthesis transport protein ExoP